MDEISERRCLYDRVSGLWSHLFDVLEGMVTASRNCCPLSLLIRSLIGEMILRAHLAFEYIEALLCSQKGFVRLVKNLFHGEERSDISLNGLALGRVRFHHLELRLLRFRVLGR